MSTPWRVTFDHATAFVEGPKAEALRRLIVCGDPWPTWIQRRQAWATSVKAANRLLDQIDGRQDFTLEDTDQTTLTFTDTVPASPGVAQGGLW